jgi:uncharacterized protein (TIGR02996 family)
MPPPGYEPFLRAICANPEDDTVRLVYADWLDENGDPERAEFIRTQVTLAGQADQLGEQYYRPAVLKKNWNLWRSELPRLSGVEWSSYFWRGFVSGVCVDTGKWLIQQREQIFQTAPIQSLVLNDAGLATLQRVLEVPEIEHLTTLTLQHSRIREGEWKALTDCPRLTRLKALHFTAVYLGYSRWVAIFSDEDARAFVETPHLPRLESLHIIGTPSPAALALLRTRFKSVKAW